MADILFPSCKIKEKYPRESERLREYLTEHFGVEVTGCCKPNRVKLTPDDRAIVMCNNCAAIIEESSAVGAEIYVWELIDGEEKFSFPDYNGERVTIQDCWAANDRHKVQRTVRSLLKKMNLDIVELPENFDATKFHGEVLLQPCAPLNAKLAPRRYAGGNSPAFTPLDEAARLKSLCEHAERITTYKVVCYCKPCAEGITKGGKEGVHILELLFPA